MSGPWEKYAAPPSDRVKQRRLQMQATTEDIRSAPVQRAASMMSVAKGAADLQEAPITRASKAIALNIDQATQDAQIRKLLADADTAELGAIAARLKTKYPDLTEQQSTSAARVILMEEGNSLYEKARKQGYEPTSLPNKAASVLKGIPVIGENFADTLRDPKGEMAAGGQRIFTEGALRTVTGAAGPKEERPQTDIQYFPSAWQSRNPEYRKHLERLRQRQIQTQRRAAGPAVSDASKLPSGMTPDQVLAQAKAAIQSGKQRAGVIEKVRAMGIDPKGL